jgi:hypothetical protein
MTVPKSVVFMPVCDTWKVNKNENETFVQFDRICDLVASVTVLHHGHLNLCRVRLLFRVRL